MLPLGTGNQRDPTQDLDRPSVQIGARSSVPNWYRDHLATCARNYASLTTAAKRPGWFRRRLVIALLGGVLGCPAGWSETEDATSQHSAEICSQATARFVADVFDPILRSQCQFCHEPGGAAEASALVLRGDPSDPASQRADLNRFCEIALVEHAGISRVLLKSSYVLEHGGGLRLAADSPEYRQMSDFIGYLRALDGCPCD